MIIDRTKVFCRNNKRLLFIIALAVLAAFSGFYLYMANYKNYGATSSFLILLTLVAVVGLILGFLLYRYLEKKKGTDWALPRVFFLTLLLLGTCYSFVFTPFSVPDEGYHWRASYAYSDVLLGKVDDSSVLTMRADDYRLEVDGASIALSAAQYAAEREKAQVWSDCQEVVESPAKDYYSVAANLPQVRLLSASGIAIGQMLGLSSLLTFMLGRLFNFLGFALLVYAAVRITPLGKQIFMGCALLPMTLHVAASYSYDAVGIGLAFLLTALCLKAIYDPGLISKKLLIAIAITGILLAPWKMIYVLLMGLVFLIPKERFANSRQSKYIKTAVCLVVFTVLLLLKLTALTAVTGITSAGGDGLDHKGEEVGTFYSLNDVIDSPLSVAFLFVNTLFYQVDFYYQTIVGGSLGWFQVEIASPWALVASFTVLLLATALVSPRDEMTLSPRGRLMAILIVSAGFFATIAAMFFGWTFNTETVIQGVQGRYFLPLLPLALLVLRTSLIKFEVDPKELILFSFMFLNLVYLGYIFAKAVVL